MDFEDCQCKTFMLFENTQYQENKTATNGSELFELSVPEENQSEKPVK
jgi:hypothetical protein